MFVFSCKTILASGLIALSCFFSGKPVAANPAPESLNPHSEAKGKDLDFSDGGRPGRQTSGESRARCPKKPIDLSTLMLYYNTGKTVPKRPIF